MWKAEQWLAEPGRSWLLFQIQEKKCQRETVTQEKENACPYLAQAKGALWLGLGAKPHQRNQCWIPNYILFGPFPLCRLILGSRACLRHLGIPLPTLSTLSKLLPLLWNMSFIFHLWKRRRIRLVGENMTDLGHGAGKTYDRLEKKKSEIPISLFISIKKKQPA